MSFWFFLSYAHADDNEFLRKFYKDLDSELRQLTGAPATEISFFDRDKIAHGASWDTALENGLKNCRVFVPLYSASYFRSEYCGKELAVFRKRLHDHLNQEGSTANDTLILPILWSHEKNVLSVLPAAVNKIQYTHGSYPPEYTAEGVSQLVKLGVTPSSKYYNQYWDFISTLADTINTAATQLNLPPASSSLTALDQVTSLFTPAMQAVNPPASESGPRNVQFIFVSGKAPELQAAQRLELKFYGANGGSDWLPYLDTYKGSACALAIETIEAFSKDSRYEEVSIGNNLEQQVRLATSQDKIVVVVIDSWTLRLPKYHQLLAPLDQFSAVNCITLIVWNDEDNEAKVFKGPVKAAVMGAFKTKVVQNPGNFLFDSVNSSNSFKTELVKALSQAQAQIVETARIKKDLEFALVRSPDAFF
ncbi:MAG TPA: TIR-like protein FxsC [Pyrinomonadaceae bacterium]|jgi:hypothetical protein|nr:TIR-like protein FxsC [Pyrinomonadaceae bacterium]